MADQLAVDYMIAVEQALGETESCLPRACQNVTRPNISQSFSDPISTTYQSLTNDPSANGSPSDQYSDTFDDTTLAKLSSENRH
jgi:hypothetical protein